MLALEDIDATRTVLSGVAGIAPLEPSRPGLPKMISQVLRASGNTVLAALALDAGARHERWSRWLTVDEFEPPIRVSLAAFPTMPATMIAERVGWTHGRTIFRRSSPRESQPVFMLPDSAGRTEVPGG
jgi:hypothetical protein